MKKCWFLMVVSLTMFVFIHINSYGQVITGDTLDPNILWQTDDYWGYTGFQIHPNGNLIANRNCEFFEIDGKNGKQIRAFPVINGYSGIDYAVTVSKDGKYFAACYSGTGIFGTTNDIYIFDYATGNVVKQLKDYGEALCFLNDSKRLVIRAYKGSLTIYDVEKDTSYYNDAMMFVQNIAVSDDGKYIATGGVSYYSPKYSIIKLWDASTLKLINEFKMKEGHDEVRSIKFSPDSKFIGSQIYRNDFYLYRINDFSLYKFYNYKNTENGVFGFCFIDTNFIGIKSGKTSIIRLNDDKQIFSAATSSGTDEILDQNKSNNSLIVGAGNIIAYNLNKIMTTVKVENPSKIFTVSYSNGILSIDNFLFESKNNNMTIFDIDGKFIKELNFTYSNENIRIPLKLINGTYILNIVDGKKTIFF